ncbi:MAG: RNA polymerase subunit sigma-24 [Chloroflexi bacterium HGW-Chloroflexi-10]|nr:MAG: RNA polymerase subunit sigma-24 [Chloroflexi bacterium HGW-Chloroflexi-10]
MQQKMLKISNPALESQTTFMNTEKEINPINTAMVLRAAAEPEAFAMIYDYFFSAIHKYIFLRIRDEQTTDDLTAQVFERLIKALINYQSTKGTFSAWLFGIARNVVNDHFRAQQRFPWLPIQFLNQMASPHPSPEKMLAYKEADQQLLSALNQLTDRERELIALKYATELNNRQIAKITGLSENNIGIILFRALRKLRDRIGKENE